MRRIFESAEISAPQFAAAALLLAFLLQCLWLVRVQALQGTEPSSDQAMRMYQGLQQWKTGIVAGTPESLRSEAATGIPSAARLGHLRVRDGYDEDRSPLYYLVAGAPLFARPEAWLPESLRPFLAATPQIFFGLMLGGSIWYVARRLYGNAGGYIALALYCFSPAMIGNVAGARSLGEMGAVWGAFGAVFTAIAVAHTLYAPREVVLWNWRRIFLLGLSIALASGTQFSLGPLSLILLPLMFWVAPVRPRSLLVIWATAMAVALVLLFAAYLFEPALFWQGMLHARWVDFQASGFAMPLSYRSVGRFVFLGSPALVIALPIASIVYCGWPRTRYFGNTAPLIFSGLALLLTLASPDFPGEGFRLTVLVFLFVFVAGVAADLLETSERMLVAAAAAMLVSASALINMVQLWRLQFH